MAKACAHFSPYWITLPLALCMAGTLFSRSLRSDVPSTGQLLLTVLFEVVPFPGCFTFFPPSDTPIHSHTEAELHGLDHQSSLAVTSDLVLPIGSMSSRLEEVREERDEGCFSSPSSPLWITVLAMGASVIARGPVR